MNCCTLYVVIYGVEFRHWVHGESWLAVKVLSLITASVLEAVGTQGPAPMLLSCGFVSMCILCCVVSYCFVSVYLVGKVELGIPFFVSWYAIIFDNSMHSCLHIHRPFQTAIHLS